MQANNVIIDGLQYINWDKKTFEKTRDSGIHVVSVTIAYWENFSEVINNINQLNQ